MELRYIEVSDIQILTVALAAVPTMLAVLAGILINNSRLNDTNARVSVEQVIDARLRHLEDAADTI
jgi:hypothetical protein